MGSALLLQSRERSWPRQRDKEDSRTQSDGWGGTEISFCSRPSPDAFGFPGHAFVGFSEEPRNQARTFRAVGHKVAASAGLVPIVFTYFGGASVAGRQAEKRYTHMKQACLTLQRGQNRLSEGAPFDAGWAVLHRRRASMNIGSLLFSFSCLASDKLFRSPKPRSQAA